MVTSQPSARAVLATRRMAEFDPTEIKPGPELTSDTGQLLAAGDVGATIFHPVTPGFGALRVTGAGQAHSRSWIWRHITFPVPDFGSSSTNTTLRGSL